MAKKKLVHYYLFTIIFFILFAIQDADALIKFLKQKNEKNAASTTRPQKSIHPNDFIRLPDSEHVETTTYTQDSRVIMKSDISRASLPLYTVKYYPVIQEPQDKLELLSHLQKFQQKISGLAKVVHVDKFGSPFSKTHYQVVMEHVEGEKMSSILPPGHLFTEGLAKVFLLQIAEILLHLHDHQVILGGLEKKDITILNNSNLANLSKLSRHLKLTNFDYATYGIYGKEKGGLGHVYIMLYEEDLFSYEIDWWLFGVLMYSMLTGKEPFPVKEKDGKYELLATKQEIDYFKAKNIEIEFDDELKISDNAKQLLKSLLSPKSEHQFHKGTFSADIYNQVIGHKWFKEDFLIRNKLFNHNKLSDYFQNEMLASKNKSLQIQELRTTSLFETSLLSLTPNDFQKNIPNALIGIGGFGSVYKVQLKDSKIYSTVYAMKYMFANEEASKNEIRIVNKLKSIPEKCPYIVNTICFDRINKPVEDIDNKKKYRVVMDYLSGGNLYKLIKNRGFLTEDLAALFLIQIAKAIKYLHQNGIIYRDLKPENVVLEGNKNLFSNDKILASMSLNGKLKLIDFGLSSTKQYPKGIKGTVFYFSPETILKKKYSFEVDWWAFGILMYEMLVGHCPFESWQSNGSIDMDKTMNKILEYFNRTYTLIYPTDIKLSAEAFNLIQKLLEPNLERRYKTYDEIMNDKWFEKNLKIFEKLVKNEKLNKKTKNIRSDYKMLLERQRQKFNFFQVS